ncbi:MAG: RagB/SusD family nutrient uptake outer membrane protein [Bacteroidales bacterium]|nr:MAG: RagB/SusD family nutrient uptake outer membrane protein [Bacteroidales bacterium]
MERIYKKRIFYLFSMIVILCMTFSCSEDFYDAKIGDRIFPDQHFNNAIDVEITYTGVTSILQEILPNYIIVDGLLTDQMEVTQAADVELRNIYYHNLSPSNSYINGSAYYKVIISANDALKHIDQVVEKDQDYDTLDNKAYRAALVAYRSWAYFNYVRLYGEAALIPDEMSSISGTSNLPMIDRVSMLDTLINHLTPYIHDNESDIAEQYVFNSINNKALLGEIYLEIGNYEKAAELLKAAVESYGNASGLYKVDRAFNMEDYGNLFVNSFANTNTVMAAVPFSFEDGQKNPLEDYFVYDYGYMIKPTTIVIDSFNSQVQQADGIGDIYRGKGVNFDTIPGSNDEYYIHKYSLDQSVLYSADIILYRSADIHLLLAEALNRLGKVNIAMTLLNTGMRELSPRPEGYGMWSRNVGVRGRVFLKSQTVPASITTPVKYREDLIIQERALELAFEGKRWFDLMRIARRRNDPSYLADKVAAKYSDPVKAEQVRSWLMNEENWYLPASR